jgi:diguanylate cyclase (GGDEF)-like protein
VDNDKVLGVLAVFSTRENEFDADDIRTLQTFAQAASAAIRNAWLFEQIDKQRATILAAVNMLPQPMMIVDQDGKIIVSNKAADTMLSDVHSSSNEECNKWSLISLIHGLSESRWCTKEIIVGEKVYVATLEYASMVGTVILLQDVTDPVTGTSNYRHFQDLAEHAFQQAKRYRKPLSALVIGLNDFQRIIDEQGHEVANQVLKRLAIEFRGFLRTPDILGRCHENEFMVFLPETNLENAKVVAERIKQSMSKKVIETKSCKLMPKLTIGTAMLDTNIHDSVKVFMESAYGEFMLVNNNHKSPRKIFPNY